MNVERDEDRTRMANSAYKNLNGVGDEFTSTYRSSRDHGTFQMTRVKQGMPTGATE